MYTSELVPTTAINKVPRMLYHTNMFVRPQREDVWFQNLPRHDHEPTFGYWMPTGKSTIIVAIWTALHEWREVYARRLPSQNQRGIIGTQSVQSTIQCGTISPNAKVCSTTLFRCRCSLQIIAHKIQHDQNGGTTGGV